jgi:hypothetical protein
VGRSSQVRAVGYRHMLLVILAVYVLIIVTTSPEISGALRVAALGLLLFQALRMRYRRGRWIWPTVLISIALVIVTVWAAVVESEVVLICTSSGATCLLVVAVVGLIIRALLAAGVIDGASVRGVLCVYLLFALFFAALFQFFGALVPNFLNGVGRYPSASDTLYFSVITLATVGYGDITPESSVARALVVAEALLGQLYLVSVVAAVVSRYRRADE